MIQNPILRGFNPDPSICRVGDDYYIATSTFEWFPGVQIHHSKDLKNWTVIAQPLNRLSQLDMKGVPDSCGVWAPCLTHHNGTFYLVYTNVKSFDGVWKDTPNFVVTTNDIKGDWSDPVYLNSSGFDGSFFHEGDKTWYTSMQIDHRQGKFFGGIELQEYSKEKMQLVGESYFISKGTELGYTEGPHIYRQNGFYYLILAEGGTEYGHAATILRAKDITGPYEEHPENPVVSCRDYPNHYLQKAGHASMVEAADGSWYIVFLVGRPLTKHGRCVLGRETAIEEVIWKDHWPYINTVNALPRTQIPALYEGLHQNLLINKLYSFSEDKLDMDFQSLRIPKNESWISLSERKGYLRLKGKESLTSTHSQSLVARRLQHYDAIISTAVEFEPEYFQQLAGLVVFYNTGHYHYLNISGQGGKKLISVISSDNFKMTEQIEKGEISDTKKVYLRAEIKGADLQFYYSSDNDNFIKIGDLLDMSILSDDHVRDGSDRYRPAFTGCFVGICCQDLRSNKKHADFEWFKYVELPRKE